MDLMAAGDWYLLANESLGTNERLITQEGHYQLQYQGDGNLVLRKRDGSYLWDTETNGRPVGRCIMQGDGNLVIYGPNGDYIWDTETNGYPNSSLVIQDDGNLVIYAPGDRAIWATYTLPPEIHSFWPTEAEPGMPISVRGDYFHITTRVEWKIKDTNEYHRARFQILDKRMLTTFAPSCENGWSSQLYVTNWADRIGSSDELICIRETVQKGY
jgi:hypothetical protein